MAAVLADVATSYVVNASKLCQLEQLSEHRQQALESRIIIEQAKGRAKAAKAECQKAEAAQQRSGVDDQFRKADEVDPHYDRT